MLLNTLINDEKKNNKKFYSSGPYWNYKNRRAISEIKKYGLNNFRGQVNSIGSSFADNQVVDVRNEFNWKGKLIGKIFSLPGLNKIFNEQLKITQSYLDLYLESISIIYSGNKDVLSLINKYKFENTLNFGCVSKFTYLEKEYSILYLNMAHRIDKLLSLFDFTKIKSFFEIGGGFGANIHFLITNFPNIKKIIYLDTVPNIYVGTEYLKFHFKNKVKDYLSIKNINKIEFANNDDLEIYCIPPWEIEKINVEIDHFHNAASFVEMPDFVIKNYCKYIKKFNTKEISLISYAEYDPQTTFNPESLNNYFEKRLNISWHNLLIKEYNKKSIYLTSK